MAKDGYNISIGADTTAAEKGIRKGVIEPLEDLNEVLEEVAKEANTSGDKLEDAMRDAQRDTEELADETKKLSAAITDAGRSSRGMGDDFKRGTDRAQDGLDELKDESRSTAKEAAASFDGSAESIVDAFQEVAANAFAGFGVAGIAAGLAVAGGIGIATSEFQKSEEAAKAAKERIREYAISIIESGKTTAELESVNEALKQIVTNADDAPKKLDDINKSINSKKLDEFGISAENLAMAFSGNADAAEMMVEQLDEAAAAQQALADASGEGWPARRAEEMRELSDELRAQQEASMQAEEAWKSYLDSGGAELEAKKEAIAGINAAYDDAVNSATDYYNAETGLFDVSGYLASMQARADALTKYQSSLASAGLTTEQKQALNEMGIDSAQAWMTGYEQASPAQKESMKQFLTESAKESSGVAIDTIDETFKKPIKAKIEAEADTKDAKKAIDKLVEDRVVKVTVDLRDREGKKVG